MRILFRAPALTLSGYGVHSRQIFEWLNSIPNVEIVSEMLRWGQTTWLVNDKYCKNIENIMSTAKEPAGAFDMSVQVQLPDEWNSNAARYNIGVSAFVETDKCNSKWIEKCNEMDAVIVPSTFTKDIIERSGKVETPIHVIPEWYNPLIEKSKNDKVRLNLDTDFNFLTVGTLTGFNSADDRKNIFNAIKWFAETFPDNPDVGLIVKTCSGKGTEIDRKLTQRTFESVMAEVKKGKKYPKIYLLHGTLNESEIASLYKHKNVNAFLLPTRGEGYGLPLVESAAAGLPIITTGYSGHMDFLKEELIQSIDYELIKIPKSRVDNRIFIQGCRWADPSESDTKEKMLGVYNNYNKYKKNAIILQKHIRNNYSKKHILQKYFNFYNLIKEEC